MLLARKALALESALSRAMVKRLCLITVIHCNWMEVSWWSWQTRSCANEWRSQEVACRRTALWCNYVVLHDVVALIPTHRRPHGNVWHICRIGTWCTEPTPRQIIPFMRSNESISRSICTKVPHYRNMAARHRTDSSLLSSPSSIPHPTAPWSFWISCTFIEY